MDFSRREAKWVLYSCYKPRIIVARETCVPSRVTNLVETAVETLTGDNLSHGSSSTDRDHEEDTFTYVLQ